MTRRQVRAGFVAVTIAGLVAIAVASTRVDSLQGPIPGPLTGDDVAGRAAPDFTGIEEWLNGGPVSIEDLRGSVVLVDFWTYSCVNCVRTFPHLRALYAAYHPFGVEIVGVHSPEFAFEREIDNVQAAIERHGLPYPVALDNDMETWRAYANRYWPHVYVIDAEGVIRYHHIGEGGEEQLQAQVRTLLAEAGRSLPAEIAFAPGGPSRGITPEIYTGPKRGIIQDSLANDEGWHPAEPFAYAEAGESEVRAAGTGGRFFLEGTWEAGEEFVRAVGGSTAVVLPFHARDVFFVGDGDATVRVLLDGRPIPAGARGDDVTGELIAVDHADLYGAIRLARPETHVLRLEVEPGFRIYSFTFG
ncbi:MAG TPA: redoxin domain-containing protein [Actinomycetota bacterium]